MHTPESPFKAAGALRVEQDGGLLIEQGRIVASGAFDQVRVAHPTAPVEDWRGGVLLPGFIDTHIHYPQVRVLGALGLNLLDWLAMNTLPEEAKFGDAGYARSVAREFLSGLASHGTTTALVFGSHYAGAMDVFFEEAAGSGLRMVAGQVLSDRLLRAELHTTPERAFAEGRGLIERWHGRGRALYAVTPRFSLSASEGILDACGALMNEADGLRFTSHLNEQLPEIEAVQQLFPWARDYLDTYERAGLVGRRSVFAHNVHPSRRELGVLAGTGASVSHCPCSNAAIGSGFFAMRAHLAAGVHFALGTDVGGGTGFGMLKEGLQAYLLQRLHPEGGFDLGAAHLLYLATRAGAEALDLQEDVGDFSVGKSFDAVLLRPPAGSTLDTVLAHADSAERSLSALFGMGDASCVHRVWVGGDVVHQKDGGPST